MLYGLPGYVDQETFDATVALLQAEIGSITVNVMPFNPRYDIRLNGDSTAAGVGSTPQYYISNILQSYISNGKTVTNGGIGGQRSEAMVATFNALPNSEKDKYQIVGTIGLNDFTTAPFTRNWATSDYTLNNIIALKNATLNGKPTFVLNTIRQDINCVGMQYGADYKFLNRRSTELLGAYAINISRYFTNDGQVVGPDLYNTSIQDGRPLTMFGTQFGGVQYAINPNSAAFIQVAGAPVDLNYNQGQFAWSTTLLQWYIKIGATGTGSWQVADAKHVSWLGNIISASVLRTAIMAYEGTGPAYCPPQELYCQRNAAATTLIGRLPILTPSSNWGNTDSATIIDGNDDGVFTIDLYGNIYRSNLGALVSKVYNITVRLGTNIGGSMYYLDSKHKIYVGRASTEVVPQKCNINSPVSLYGLEGWNFPTTRKFSGAFWGKFTNFDNSPYLTLMGPGSGFAGIQHFIRFGKDAINGKGRFSINVTNGGATVLNAISTTASAGAVGIDVDTWGWLTWSVDMTAGLVTAYWNDGAMTFTGKTQVDSNIPFGNMSPLFLNGRKLYGADRTGVQPVTGGIGMMALWADYIDWTSAPIRRQLFNVDLSPAINDYRCIIDGKTAAIVPWYGHLVDMQYGGLNSSQLVFPSYNARTSMVMV